MPNDWNTNAGKRNAAKLFLERLVTDGDLRQKVVKSADDDRDYAREQFKDLGDCPNIPDDVEIICVEPDKTNLNKLVVFKLPELSEDSTAVINPLEHWIAAWVPYGPGSAQLPPGEN